MIYDFKDYKEVVNKNKKWIKFAIIIVAFIGALILTNKLYLKILELDEIGNLSSIYIKNLTWKVFVALAMGIFAFVTILVQNIFIKRNMNSFLRLHGEQQNTFYKWLPALTVGVIFIIAGFNKVQALALCKTILGSLVATIHERGRK